MPLTLGPMVGSTNAQPHTVYVYNHNPGDVFDNNAEAWIWNQLGLLDATGAPLNPVPDAQIIRDDDDAVIGYRSADGTREAYDVNSSATTAQAWGRVKSDGTLHIAKHGATYKDNGIEYEGGGILLDDGQAYDGFGTGTGVCYERADSTCGPYALPDRPGATITLNANGCFTSKDPDGVGDEGSVTGSASGVVGVGAAVGNMPKIYKIVRSSVGGGTSEQRSAARAALLAAARAAGFPPVPEGGGPRPPSQEQDRANWIATLPARTRHATVQGIVDETVPPAGTVQVTLTYEKTATAPGGGDQGGFYHVPLMIPPGEIGNVTYLYDETWPAASIVLTPPSLSRSGVFDIDILGELPAPVPGGLSLASGVFRFESISGDVFTQPVELIFGTDAPTLAAQVLWYEPGIGTWTTPSGAVVVDPIGGVRVSTTQMGVYAAFRPVTTGLDPPPPRPYARLAQNSPNPFRSVTRIAFEVPAPQRVRLSVFDTRGRRVATLLDDSVEAGRHSLELDSRDLPSGVYFYALEAGRFSQAKKLVVSR